jgi:hypothetical protein
MQFGCFYSDCDDLSKRYSLKDGQPFHKKRDLSVDISCLDRYRVWNFEFR